jgi:hypothetical protein
MNKSTTWEKLTAACRKEGAMGNESSSATKTQMWPELPLNEWQDTLATFHRWTQILGKIKLKCAPMINHWWQVPLYVTSRGLTTSPLPCPRGVFEITLDLIDHQMRITTDSGAQRSIALRPITVAEFYQETLNALHSLGIEVRIWTTPVEVSDRTPFEKDVKHSAYDAQYIRRCWKILVQADRVMREFRSRFIGKASPVHFFWGAFDIAASRFSGRIAPEHPGSENVGRSVSVEAYSHEVSSCGFWPGNGLNMPAFYAYFYPEPAGFKEAHVQPEEAAYNTKLGEFILPYDAVRTAEFPDEKLLAFFQSTYEAGANLAGWSRVLLERESGTRLLGRR